MKACPKCQTSLPDEARFCSQCGSPQLSAPEKEPAVTLHWDQALAPQIIAHFFSALQQNVHREHDASRHAQFSERVYESGFRDIVHRRAQQLADKLDTQLGLDAISKKAAGKQVEWVIDELVDFFVIRYCQDLLEIPLPEAILRYQQLSPEQIDQFQMVLDYLDFAHESEVVYTDFLVMPVDKLKNAGRSFLFPEKNERIWLICDQSILGSCKEGFALTEKGLYWKAHLQQARQVSYTNLQSIEREKDWLNINSFFFNVNAALNLKMMKLLRKLNRLKSLK